jgi:hypothetical protein
MDIYVVVALIWLASAGLAGWVGFLGGRTGDALTLGTLLGPIGCLLAVGLVLPAWRRDPDILPFPGPAVAGPGSEAISATRLRQAA